LPGRIDGGSGGEKDHVAKIILAYKQNAHRNRLPRVQRARLAVIPGPSVHQPNIRAPGLPSRALTSSNSRSNQTSRHVNSVRSVLRANAATSLLAAPRTQSRPRLVPRPISATAHGLRRDGGSGIAGCPATLEAPRIRKVTEFKYTVCALPRGTLETLRV